MKKRLVVLLLVCALALALAGCAGEPGELMECHLVIDCSNAVAEKDRLPAATAALLPEDGIFLNEWRMFREGDTAYDVLRESVVANGLHMEVQESFSGAIYVNGLCNLYEFDMGDLSGWMFTVNRRFPDTCCSDYVLSDGDLVEFIYTRDIGHDIDLDLPW